jgi:DNA-binding IclR family transcriptional regulator
VGTLAGPKVLVVHHVFRPDDSAQELEVGGLLPVHASALGKVLLATGPAQPQPAGGAPLESFTPATRTDPAVLAAELRAVRARGWASQREEHRHGVAALAAPVRGAGGLVVCALGVSGTVETVLTPAGDPRPALLAMVLDAAAAVSRELGRP